ncbi:SEC-C metal-binding domain-containing protein [Sphingosinicella microcystinivorans]|uniref:SEC-C motif-containing protein n=1 Tax=Sphingosinicella microcystinivorans TaxID=335406 RepID=A0AAD1D6L8_SPHMI|nr:SEC-C domain-containing protein [Sphingosinicella microcystinivorans]RKS91336.1 SEC-C motif-containing protein [Sphingosinicella microcystinivorans]BBE34307.1 hypothetical protein SmB9_19650 [Sphingosinicella microcystinivorans]
MPLRNNLCACGSGKRHKHCHGAVVESREIENNVTDQALIAALKRADDEGIRLGQEPSARSLLNIGRALREFGYEEFVLIGRNKPSIVERAQKFNNMLFVPKELKMGCMHLGAFLFRDMFCRLYTPVSVGEVRIDFWEMLDLSDFQKKWLTENPDDLACFTDQSADILDFGYGCYEFGHQRKIDSRGQDLIWRAHTQLEAAAATATSAYDFRGTIQSALLGTELALKAGLAAFGVSDAELRTDIGHNLCTAAIRLSKFCPLFEVDRVQRVVGTFPRFVASRYNLPPPSRTETGHILMGAQYVASEVTRQFSDRDCRRDNPAMSSRQYPS